MKDNLFFCLSILTGVLAMFVAVPLSAMLLYWAGILTQSTATPLGFALGIEAILVWAFVSVKTHALLWWLADHR
jgi:hypothetical protein